MTVRIRSSRGDDELRDEVAVHREAIPEIDDATGEVALQAIGGDPAPVFGALRGDESGRVGELGPGPGEEASDLLATPVGRAVVDDHRGRREGAERGVGVAGDVRGEVAADRGRQTVGVDTGRRGHAPTVRPPGAGGSSSGLSPGGRVQRGGMLAIGDFSRLTHLSVRTLRRYHDAGLLEPATVDDATGYRYYSADQIPTAQVIHRLRELDVPLPDVQRILRSPDPRARAGLVADHLRRLEADLDRTRAAVASLRRLLQPQPPPLDVELRAVPAATVAAVEDDVPYDEVLAWYAGAIAELDAVVGEPTGPPGGLYDNALFEDGRGHLLVYRPTVDPPRSGRVRPVTLPAVELVVTTHVGKHDDIDVTYGDLGAWVVANALAVAGPVRETYLVGPRDTADPSAWRTEIGWPVFRVSPR